ncbi:MAG: fused MFS/spermidine synthase [Candidatus Binatia bacterium]|nr:fused MFS/spermidine synthase [Candidatus Binatia bacterium]
MTTGPEIAGRARTGLLAVFFASGVASLVYEVLWLRDLRLVLGSGAHATATTLAVFFTGLAAGSAFFGGRAARSSRPLLLYAGLEVGIGVTALLSFGLPAAHLSVYPTLVTTLGTGTWGLVLGRVALSFLFLLPPAVLMGGTLPVMGEVFVRRPTQLATTTGVLYATNTAGAAVGALLAGFVLPVWLGFRGSYATAIALNLALGALAAVLSYVVGERPAPSADEKTATRPMAGWLAGYAFLGGFATLALEVLWTRMFALVLNSSVYAFSTILVVFLLALSTGAALSARIVPRLPPDLHLFALLLGAGLAIGGSPFALHAATGQLGSIPSQWGFAPYVILVFGTALLVVLPPAALCGAVLPALLRFCEREGTRPGETIGRLVALNTAGGVFGSLVAGFALLPTIGLWRSVQILAFLYLVLALFCVGSSSPGARYLRAAALVATVLFGTFLDPTRLALVRVEAGEIIEKVWETPHGVVTVTRDDGGRRIRLDNTYILGGTEGHAEEALQADLPLALHGAPQRVFFLGLGSGITAASALAHPVKHVIATELLPEVVEASRSYFEESAGALFSDERAQVLAVDGRIHLATTHETWDVIISDLFIPWHEGTGSLYTKEHFETVRARLAAGGIFAQWLPFFQLSRNDFDTIARTMLDVFSNVTLWHASFRDDEPIAVLIARRHDAPHETRLADPPARFGGVLRKELFASAPLNTDDRPILEYRAPLSQAAVRSERESWLTGPELDRLLFDIRRSNEKR